MDRFLSFLLAPKNRNGVQDVLRASYKKRNKWILTFNHARHNRHIFRHFLNKSNFTTRLFQSLLLLPQRNKRRKERKKDKRKKRKKIEKKEKKERKVERMKETTREEKCWEGTTTSWEGSILDFITQVSWTASHESDVGSSFRFWPDGFHPAILFRSRGMIIERRRWLCVTQISNALWAPIIIGTRWGWKSERKWVTSAIWIHPCVWRVVSDYIQSTGNDNKWRP